MKYLGAITHDNDIATKKYVDDHAGGSYTASVPIVINSGDIQLQINDGTDDRKVQLIARGTVDGISGLIIAYNNGTLDGGYVFLPDGAGFATGSQAIISQIPTATSQLTNDSGFITAAQVPTELPAVTSADNGKVLRVTNGAWAAVQLPSASGVSF